MNAVYRNVKKNDTLQWKNVRNKSGKPDYFFIKKYYTQTIVLFVYLSINIII